MTTTSSPPSAAAADMKITFSPARATQLAENLASIQSRITSTLKSHNSSNNNNGSKAKPPPPRLVAVSKLKPASDILALHSPPTSHVHFGENYVQELVEKSRLLPRSIRWHFIGGLQSNKCAALARDVPNLWAVESVDSVKKASLLNKGRGESRGSKVNEEDDSATEQQVQEQDGNDNDNRSNEESSLRIYVQVNTSGEASKSGVDPQSPELLELCSFIRGAECPHLTLQGLMTIGAIARSQATTAENENDDFLALRAARDRVVEELGIVAPEQLELSMGMSEDFEGAIVLGSNEVRVGSTIFGERPAKKDAVVVEDQNTK